MSDRSAEMMGLAQRLLELAAARAGDDQVCLAAIVVCTERGETVEVDAAMVGGHLAHPSNMEFVEALARRLHVGVKQAQQEAADDCGATRLEREDLEVVAIGRGKATA